MKSFFALMFAMFLAITMTACAKTKQERYCVHPLINGGNAFPLLESSTLDNQGNITDKGIKILGAMCAIVDVKAE